MVCASRGLVFVPHGLSPSVLLQLRMAFRTVLEEVNRGPPRSMRFSDSFSANGSAAAPPGSFAGPGAQPGSFANGSQPGSSAAGSQSAPPRSHAVMNQPGGGGGGFGGSNSSGLRSLSEVLQRSDAEETRQWMASTGATGTTHHTGAYEGERQATTERASRDSGDLELPFASARADRASEELSVMYGLGAGPASPAPPPAAPQGTDAAKKALGAWGR